jgi:hypothetical protein
VETLRKAVNVNGKNQILISRITCHRNGDTVIKPRILIDEILGIDNRQKGILSGFLVEGPHLVMAPFTGSIQCLINRKLKPLFNAEMSMFS